LGWDSCSIMKNPLLDLYLKHASMFRWFETLEPESLRFLLLATWYIMLWNPADVEQKLTKFYGNVIDGPKVLGLLDAMKRRYVYSDQYAWAVPNEEAIGVLVEHSPLVEVGAGRGYWARLAAQAGADILAFDPFPPGTADVNKWHHPPGLFFDVAKGGAEVAADHPDRTLFLCWPPWGQDVASRTLRSYQGNTVIYVGDEGLSAATPEFYSELAAGWTKVRVVDIPQWPGIRDRLEVWQRSEATS
jgi:hypothetical protein